MLNPCHSPTSASPSRASLCSLRLLLPVLMPAAAKALHKQPQPGSAQDLARARTLPDWKRSTRVSRVVSSWQQNVSQRVSSRHAAPPASAMVTGSAIATCAMGSTMRALRARAPLPWYSAGLEAHGAHVSAHAAPSLSASGAQRVRSPSARGASQRQRATCMAFIATRMLPCVRPCNSRLPSSKRMPCVKSSRLRHRACEMMRSQPAALGCRPAKPRPGAWLRSCAPHGDHARLVRE